MFDLFQFTEKTTRLRRNLLIFALLCFCVGFFNVSVESIPLGGYAIKLPPKAFEFALASMLGYHFITFYWAAIDEYKHWELAVADKMQLFADGGPPQKSGFLRLIDQKIERIGGSDGFLNFSIKNIVAFKKSVDSINKIIEDKEISDKGLSILSDHISEITTCYNNSVGIMEGIEEIKLIGDDFVNKFKKYRTFTMIRLFFVEFLIPFIASLIALVWGVMEFQYLWVD